MRKSIVLIGEDPDKKQTFIVTQLPNGELAKLLYSEIFRVIPVSFTIQRWWCCWWRWWWQAGIEGVELSPGGGYNPCTRHCRPALLLWSIISYWPWIFFIFWEVFGFWLNSAYGPYYGATLLFSWLFIFFGEIQPIRKNVAFGTGWILREKSVLGFLFLAFILGPTYHVRSWKKYFFHFYYSCWQYWLICCYFWPHISCQVMQVWRRKNLLPFSYNLSDRL